MKSMHSVLRNLVGAGTAHRAVTCRQPRTSWFRTPWQGVPALSCLAASAVLVVGCAVGPTYHPPRVAAPSSFKEESGWKAASPDDDGPKGAWWEAFGDPVLNELETRAQGANLTVQQAAAAYEEARQIARADRATLLPSISATGAATRDRSASASRLVGGSAVTNTYNAGLGASWEPDFWGRLRRQTEADVAAAQASAADLANSRLSIESELAQDYVALRVADEKEALLQDASKAYERTLTITLNKYAVGVAAKSDVLSSEALLDATRAQAVDVGVQRAQLEHAIAILLGVPPAAFSLAPEPAFRLPIPPVPHQLASTLLERRPDVASAERLAAEANAKVGVQTAAYFPAISLTGDVGYESSAIHKLFEAPNRIWSLGASASETLLDWGQRRAELLEARAAYDSAVASYRSTVLGAFQQVEDDLAGLRILAQEAEIQDKAVEEAAQATQIAINEYKAGTVDYTTVVTAEVAELDDRESALATRGSRLADDVMLIVALGGGWNAADLPSYQQVVARRPQSAGTIAAGR